jgi:hypothetical protein
VPPILNELKFSLLLVDALLKRKTKNSGVLRESRKPVMARTLAKPRQMEEAPNVMEKLDEEEMLCGMRGIWMA